MSDSVYGIQKKLRDIGYDPGPLDGVFGSKTATAINALITAGGSASHASAATPSAVKPPSRQIIQDGKYQVSEIIVHCSATRPEWMPTMPLQEKRAEIRRWHLANGWTDIGYHWLIDRDGKVLAGRSEMQVGAHTHGHNNGTIGICLIGGFGSDADDRFDQHFTGAQAVTLVQLIGGIAMRAAITKISGHNQYAAKACPGFSVPKWWAAQNKDVT